jgi:hypothetical protein
MLGVAIQTARPLMARQTGIRKKRHARESEEMTDNISDDRDSYFLVCDKFRLWLFRTQVGHMQ